MQGEAIAFKTTGLPPMQCTEACGEIMSPEKAQTG